jgi:hypothetical protein
MRSLATATLVLALAASPATGQIVEKSRYYQAPVSAVASGPFSISLSWTPVGGAGSYQVSRGLAAAGPFVPVTTVPSTQTGFSDQGLLPGTAFFYQILPLAAPAYSAPTKLALANAPTSGATLQSTTTFQPITGSSQTAAAPAPGLTKSCTQITSPFGQYQGDRCSYTWQPVPGSVEYRIYRNSSVAGLGCVPVRVSGQTTTLYTLDFPYPDNAYCKTWMVRAVFRMNQGGTIVEKESADVIFPGPR